MNEKVYVAERKKLIKVLEEVENWRKEYLSRGRAIKHEMAMLDLALVSK